MNTGLDSLLKCLGSTKRIPTIGLGLVDLPIYHFQIIIEKYLVAVNPVK